MIYIYELYGWNFEDYVSGRIYSDHDLLEENELMTLIEKAIKCVGETNSDDPEKIANKVNEFLGVEPSRRNIAEYVDIRYTFANGCNCGGYFGNKEIYNWLEGDDCDFISKRFFTWWENWKTKVRFYEPCRYSLDISRG